MKNNAKRILALAIGIALCLSLCAFGAEENTFLLRIEGCTETFFSGSVAVPEDAVLWTALKGAMDENGISYTVTQSGSDVFIKSIEGEETGMFEWLDGWMYKVNGVSPTDYVSSYKVKAGDEVVVYYGDMLDTVPPVITLSPAAPKEGDELTVNVSGEYDILDNYWNVVGTYLEPMEGAEVTFDGATYITDSEGNAHIGRVSGGKHSYSVRMDDEGSYPYLIRTGEIALDCGAVACVYGEDGVTVTIEAMDAENPMLIYSVTENGKVVSCAVKQVELSSGFSEEVALNEGQTLWISLVGGYDSSAPVGEGNIGVPLGRAIVNF